MARTTPISPPVGHGLPWHCNAGKADNAHPVDPRIHLVTTRSNRDGHCRCRCRHLRAPIRAGHRHRPVHLRRDRHPDGLSTSVQRPNIDRLRLATCWDHDPRHRTIRRASGRCRTHRVEGTPQRHGRPGAPGCCVVADVFPGLQMGVLQLLLPQLRHAAGGSCKLGCQLRERGGRTSVTDTGSKRAWKKRRSSGS